MGHSTGATVSHLNMRDIRNLELPKLPRLPTQRKIAAVLSSYDDLIENNTRRIKILEEMASAIYREWFAIPQAEDLILAREAPVGNVAIIPKNLKICLGQRTVLIRPDKNKVCPIQAFLEINKHAWR